MDERKLLLNQKLKLNKQKNWKRKLINELPRDLSTIIDKSEIITSPKSEIILDKVHEKWNFELHKSDFAINYSSYRKEFSWEEEVIRYVQGIDIADEQVYLFFGINDSPIFIVNGNWAIKNFSILWKQIKNNDFWIISKDISYGIIVSCYGGYLEHDPNPRELFYAITKWDN